MDNPSVSGLRSRSRSKTPYLRSSCDRENCLGGEEHASHKTGRKTPIKRSTPIKQLKESTSKAAREVIAEEDAQESPPAHRTRHAAWGRTGAGVAVAKTSDYSSEESLDRLRGHRKEIIQNEINSQYERVSTSNYSHRYTTLDNVTLSPIHTQNVTHDRSSRFGSPSYSACSSDSSFAEQALADASALLGREPGAGADHLPYRLYKLAGEYWNKYPKTDYTYSPMSKDRVELAPGQVAVPNMSRRSLSQFRLHGPNTSPEELQRLASVAHTTRKRFTSVDSSDDESYVRPNGGYYYDQRWWITRVLIAIYTTIVTTITTTASSAYRSVVGPSHRYPYTERRAEQASVASRAASVAAAPLVWIYSMIKKVVTTTVTTVTETITPNHMSASEKSRSRYIEKTSKRQWWPWLLLLLLPILGYGSHYTYENFDNLAMPNFTNLAIDLKEFTTEQLPTIILPNISLPSLPQLPTINLTLPDINITLPDLADNMPEVSKTYREYKDIVQNRVGDASEYVKVVAESCYEEVRRFWRGVLG